MTQVSSGSDLGGVMGDRPPKVWGWGTESQMLPPKHQTLLGGRSPNTSRCGGQRHSGPPPPNIGMYCNSIVHTRSHASTDPTLWPHVYYFPVLFQCVSGIHCDHALANVVWVLRCIKAVYFSGWDHEKNLYRRTILVSPSVHVGKVTVHKYIESFLLGV